MFSTAAAAYAGCVLVAAHFIVCCLMHGLPATAIVVTGGAWHASCLSSTVLISRGSASGVCTLLAHLPVVVYT